MALLKVGTTIHVSPKSLIPFAVVAEISIDILRGLQGCGAAATIPACVSTLRYTIRLSSDVIQLGILAHSFPPSKMRSVAFATFAAGAPLGAAIGNTFGAILTQFTR